MSWTDLCVFLLMLLAIGYSMNRQCESPSDQRVIEVSEDSGTYSNLEHVRMRSYEPVRCQNRSCNGGREKCYYCDGWGDIIGGATCVVCKGTGIKDCLLCDQ